MLSFCRLSYHRTLTIKKIPLCSIVNAPGKICNLKYAKPFAYKTRKTGKIGEAACAGFAAGFAAWQRKAEAENAFISVSVSKFKPKGHNKDSCSRQVFANVGVHRFL